MCIMVIPLSLAIKAVCVKPEREREREREGGREREREASTLGQLRVLLTEPCCPVTILQQGLVMRPLQTERWRITLSRRINTKSSIK